MEKIIERLLAESAQMARARAPHVALSMCESPIEQLMLLALWARGGWTSRLSIYQGPATRGLLEEIASADGDAVLGVQVPFVNYRADFMLVQPLSRAQAPQCLIVECDGHEFHEKTKEQARRDKMRDRTMLAGGATVMRFTGSEIWRNPGRCADDVLTHLDSTWRASSDIAIAVAKGMTGDRK